MRFTSATYKVPSRKGEPAWHVEPARQHVDLIRPLIAVPVDHGVHLALGA